MEAINSVELNYTIYADAINFVNAAVIEPDFISKSFLVKKKWLCVPVETGLHFSEDDVCRISKVCKSLAISHCFAILTEDLSIPKLFKFGTSKEDLFNFNYECGGFNYAMIPDSQDFLISCSTNDFYVIAGEKNIVEELLGCTIEQGKSNFVRYAKNRKISIKILNYYEL